MKKILLVANTDWYLYRFRLSLARTLREAGNEIVLVSPKDFYVTAIESEGFRHVPWQVGRQSLNPFGEIKAVLDLLRIFRQEKPDLVHLHTVKPVLYGSLAARLAKIPFTVRSITGRGYIFLGSDLRARLLRPLIKQIFQVALQSSPGATIFENQNDRQYFISENLVRPQDTHLIEGVGVDTDYYTPLPEPQGLPVVVLAARMLWDKGVDTFVKASEILRLNFPARFVLVGEPDPGNPASIPVEVLKTWVDQGSVEWWGWQADMRKIFAACHLVTLPSLAEGIPTVLLEAAASGRAIVTTDAPGCREVVQHGYNGLLFPPRDPAALAEAIQKLLENPQLRGEMAKNGRRLVESKFSSKLVIEQTMQIYAAG